ncbi:dihydrofolate reductase family protein [Elizabethkingia meningoseptica]|uniref:dihydrofolate reductase family protein n=1 Tax=Elizabethkingia meningoseptica TaxID=238 RepID=UPI0023AFD287|nr:dihydrofolate reductase family protein [Elizabethkingia meningoseptica]MDE5469634.1 dihydrofolate reductase family protein [Elizabethkingia meningoseptica]MDE5476552.1 dihydrofolate reductase family protein [Elizabethkingia meningoseptica]MDE5479807.1 dihydrofolate reductase family protein [Elizabethkingia meningoseptica]MDE5486871.1 dihydrofolate reductase family protein [Elizabethkingia meningoseptica]MDE5503212.1 dihydrofolate reductase family protein [Elizabethkingia meningoseptica]
MRKLILIVHTSLDGYIAHTDGSFEGLNPGSNNLDYVCSAAEEADTVLSGRTTFQMLNTYWPIAYKDPNASLSEIRYSKWYNTTRKIVVSTTMKSSGKNIEVIPNDAPQHIKQLKQEKGKAIVIFGSPMLFQSILPFDLIDEFHIILYPVILGDGIPLFKGNYNKKNFSFSTIIPLSNGEVALKCISQS